MISTARKSNLSEFMESLVKSGQVIGYSHSDSAQVSLVILQLTLAVVQGSFVVLKTFLRKPTIIL